MIYSLLSLAAFLSNGGLGVYVFLKNPKNKINRSFFLLMITLFVWQVGEFIIRLAENIEVARLGVNIYKVGVAFLPPVFLYFTLIFPTEKIAYTKNKIFLFIFFAPSIAFTMLNLWRFDLLTREIFPASWGYAFRMGDLYPLFLSYFILYTGIGIVNLMNIYLTAKKDIIKKQSQFFLFGAAIAFLLGSFTDVIAPIMNLSILPIASVLTVFADICIAYAILKYRLMIAYPTAEEMEESVPKYCLEKGKAYLVEERKPEKSYEIFVDLVRHGAYGLCITRTFPEMVRKKYLLEKTPFLWLSNIESGDGIDPQDLGKMKHIITEFMSASHDTVILLDGLEYLLVEVGFERLIKALHGIVDIAVTHGGMLIVSLDPEAFNNQEISFVKRELEEIG
jgi:multisubunit Na+/H+ antiporter MnhC subunit